MSNFDILEMILAILNIIGGFIGIVAILIVIMISYKRINIKVFIKLIEISNFLFLSRFFHIYEYNLLPFF